MRENKKEKITGGDYLSLGLYAFAGLGMEGVYAYLLEPILYGTPMQDWSNLQIILHWIITCITWGAFAFILIQKSSKKYDFPLLEKGKPMKLWQSGLCVLFILLAHIFTKDLLTGMSSMILGFAMGSVYLLVNRDLKKAYIALFFMFVL